MLHMNYDVIAMEDYAIEAIDCKIIIAMP